MRSIIICEKPTKAANVRAAVGARYGQIFAAQGHLLRLMLAKEDSPAWKQRSARRYERMKRTGRETAYRRLRK